MSNKQDNPRTFWLQEGSFRTSVVDDDKANPEWGRRPFKVIEIFALEQAQNRLDAALLAKDAEIELLRKQLEKAESVRAELIHTTNKLERMLTKSNGVSFYVRDSYQRELLGKEFEGLVEMIDSMYEFQCEVEQYLKDKNNAELSAIGKG